MKLLIESGAHQGTELELVDEVVVGRESDCDLILDDDQRVSRRHARFHRSPEGDIVLDDLGSSNGTYVDGERITGEVTLVGGERVQLGRTLIVASNAAEPSAQPRPTTIIPSTEPPPLVQVMAPGSGRSCPACGRDRDASVACQFCGQVAGLPTGVRLSPVGKRLGAYILDVVIACVTLGVGWFIWSLFTWSRGQSPAKQLLGMRVVHLRTGRSATWGRMLLREIVGKAIGAVVASLTFTVLFFMLLWDGKRQEVWDKIADTIVVDDPRAEQG